RASAPRKLALERRQEGGGPAGGSRRLVAGVPPRAIFGAHAFSMVVPPPASRRENSSHEVSIVATPHVAGTGPGGLTGPPGRRLMNTDLRVIGQRIGSY